MEGQGAPKKRGPGRPRKDSNVRPKRTPNFASTIKLRCPCGDGEDGSPTVICMGASGKHKPMRFHESCIDDDERPEVEDQFKCSLCSGRSQEAADAEEQRSHVGSQGESWEVSKVLGILQVPGGPKWYGVSWKKLAHYRKWTPEWVHERDFEAYDCLAAYERDEDPPGYTEEDRLLDEPLRDHDQADMQAGNPYYPYIRQGYTALASALWPEYRNRKAARGKNFKNFVTDCHEILAAVDTDILLGICGAGLQRRKAGDARLARILKQNRQGSRWPCIYYIELCDSRGNSMTAAEMRIFVRRAKQYAALDPTEEDINFAIAVDRVRSSYVPDQDEEDAIREGQRRYLPNDRAREQLNRLIAGIERELKDHPDDYRLPFLLTEVGYTSRSDKRYVI